MFFDSQLKLDSLKKIFAKFSKIIKNAAVMIWFWFSTLNKNISKSSSKFDDFSDRFSVSILFQIRS